MATNWSFISAASDVTISSTSTVVATPNPNTGDLLVVSWASSRNSARFTGVGITDNGSGGWQTLGSFQAAGTFTSAQSWWKVASAQDDNLGAGFAATVTGTGGSGTFTQYVECDVFRLPRGYAVVGPDLVAATVGLTSVTTFSLSPVAGTSYAGFTDALAWTSWSASLEATNGGVTGSNTFTGASSAANLAVAITTNDTILLNQYVGGVTASATAGTNVWKNTWTTSRGPIFTGATFVYTTDTGLSVPTYSVQVSMTDPYDTPDWIDITKWVKSGSVKRGRQHELQRAVAGTCALTMSNQDGRFSTFNANSPYVNIMTAADSYFQDQTDFGGSVAGTWGNRTNCTLILAPDDGYDGYPGLILNSTTSGTMSASTGTGTSGYPVVAGNAYGFQCQFGFVSVARSCAVGVGWYNSGGTIIGSVTFGSSLPDLGGDDWAKATLTATAPAGAVTCALFAQVQSTGGANEQHIIVRAMISNADQQGNVVTAWAPGGRGLVPTRPVKVLATSALVTYPVYYGYIDSWVPAYTGPVLSDQVINCTDGLNLLALAYVTSTDYEPQCAVDGAVGFWYFGDSVGSQTVADTIGNNPLSQVFGSPLPNFGQPILLGGDTHSSASMSQPSFAENAFTTYTAPTAWTLECVINTNTLGNINQSNHYASFVLLTNVTGGIQGDQTGVTAWEGPGGVNLGSKNINDGQNHHLALTVTSGGAWAGYVDGVLDVSGTGPGPSGTQTGIATGIGTFNSLGPISFDIAGLVYTPSALSAAQVAVHAGLAMDGFVQQQSGQRITAILNVLGIPTSLLNIATGISAVQAPQSSLATTPSLSYIQTVENTEQGFFFVDEAGNFTFLDRHYTIQSAAATTSNATFANDANATHFKYLEGSIIPAADALDLWNDAPVSATANAALGVVGDIQDAPNTDSERWYGRRTIQGYSSMLQTTDTEALSLSQWLVTHYGLPIPRVRQMKLDSTVTNPSSIPQMLGRKLWDNVTISWQPMDGTTSPFVQASLIESIQHDFSPELWTTTWGLSVAETQDYFILNSSTNGTLAATGALTGNRLAY